MENLNQPSELEIRNRGLSCIISRTVSRKNPPLCEMINERVKSRGEARTGISLKRSRFGML